MTVTTYLFPSANGTEVLNAAPFTSQGSGGNTGLQCNGSGQGKLTSGSDNLAWHGQDIGSPDMFVEARLYTGADDTTFTQGPLSVRAVDRTDHLYALYTTGDGRWGLYTALGRDASVVRTFNSGSLFRLTSQSGIVKLWEDEVEILSVDLSWRNASATYGGLNCLCVASQSDNPIMSHYRSGLFSEIGGGSSIVPILNSYRQRRL